MSKLMYGDAWEVTARVPKTQISTINLTNMRTYSKKPSISLYEAKYWARELAKDVNRKYYNIIQELENRI